MTANLKAFLSTLAHSEGTKGLGNDGYNVLVGSRPNQVITFSSYHDHPRTMIRLNEILASSAAGRYQILGRIFDAYKKPLSLPDFGPQSQDRIAIQLINECHAYEDVLAGHFEKAIDKCKSRWASLPGSGFGQHENSLLSLRIAYTDFGGILS